MVLEWVIQKYSEYEVIHQLSLPSLPNRKFDITIEKMKIIIEIDGKQHTEESPSHWTSTLEKIQEADLEKMKQAIDEGYTLIRIPQEEIWEEKIDWRSALSSSIDIYDSPLCIFISKKGEYWEYHIPSIEEGIDIATITL